MKNPKLLPQGNTVYDAGLAITKTFITKEHCDCTKYITLPNDLLLSLIERKAILKRTILSGRNASNIIPRPKAQERMCRRGTKPLLQT